MAQLISTMPRFALSINGAAVNYTLTGIVLDHTNRRVRGCAVDVEDAEGFCATLRRLVKGERVRLKLDTSGKEFEYDGSAEVVMVRERFDRRSVPGVTFIFKLLDQ